MGVLEAIRQFFAILFSGNSPEGKRLKELRRIQHILKATEPPVLKGKSIQPVFASSLYSFCQFLITLKELFEKTVFSPDKRTAYISQDKIIDSLLTQSELDRKDSFSYEKMKTGLDKAENSKVFLEETEHNFNNFLKTYEGQVFSKGNEILVSLENLYNLCNFNYEGIFCLFDPGFSLKSTSGGNFAPVDVKLLDGPLCDFYFVYHNVVFDMELASKLSLVFALVSQEPLSDEEKTKIAKYTKNLGDFSQNQLSKDLIVQIVRYEKENPDYVLDYCKEQKNFVGDRVQRLKSVFKANIEKLKREVPEGAIVQAVNALFEENPLLPVTGYNEDISNMIQEVTPFYFEWVKPLRIIKTFVPLCFSEQFNTVVNTILVEGFFSNKQFEGSLSSTYFYSTSISQHIEDFEKSFKPGMPNDAQVILTELKSFHQGGDVEKKVASYVQRCNYLAKELIHTETNKIQELFSCIDDVIVDSKKVTPDNVINIRTIISSKPFDYIGVLEKSRDLAAKFIGVMQNFTVVKS